MRIASNRVGDLLSFLYSQLTNKYSSSEIDEIAFRLFEHYLGFKREEMKTRDKENINQSDLILMYDAIKRLASMEPLQYVLGESYFYKFKFYVDKHVLIPRPETEELVELIYNDNKGSAPRVIDFGTGSGCIPVSLKCLIPEANVEACDISEEALLVAKKNAMANKADVVFMEADILNLKENFGLYDVIVSNPPYIKLTEANTIHENVKSHEPHLALFVNDSDAIIFYKKIIDFAAKHLNALGKLYFELNPLTAENVKEYASASTVFNKIELINDMSGNTRFFKALKK